MASTSDSQSDMELSQRSQDSTPSKRNVEEQALFKDVLTPSKMERNSFDYFASKRAGRKRQRMEASITTIADLKKGVGRDDAIQFRVTWTSGHVKTSDKGITYFKFMAMDNSGKITCTAFNDVAVAVAKDIEVGKTYELNGFAVVNESKVYGISGNKLALNLQDYSELKPLPEDDIPVILHNAVTVRELQKLPKGSRAGVMVKDWGLDGSKNTTKIKRGISFVDKEGETGLFTLFDDMVANFEFVEGEVAGFFNLRVMSVMYVNEYNGEKFFNVYETSTIINPATGQKSLELKEAFNQRLAAIDESSDEGEVEMN